MARPSIQQILSYWESRVDESDLGVDMAEAAERCWRCGYRSKLHRCHIVPKSLDGANEPSNFVLLCSRCHREAPNIRNPQFIWQWIKATKQPLYDTYWTQRGIDEFARIFGRQPFEGMASITPSGVDELIGVAMRDASFHWGECGMSPSTVAAVLADVESRLRDRRRKA